MPGASGSARGSGTGASTSPPTRRRTSGRYSWFQGYAKRYDAGQLQNFTSSFGNFASAQNPFMSGKLAMVLQGVWMGNFIQKHSPGLRWGAAPFPSEKEGGPPVAIADADMLVIPAGARHPSEAFEFIKYVTQRGPMEKLCLGSGRSRRSAA